MNKYFNANNRIVIGHERLTPKTNTRIIIKKFSRYFSCNKKEIILVFVIVFFSTILRVLTPSLIGKAIDQIGEIYNLGWDVCSSIFIQLICLIIFLYFLAAILSYFEKTKSAKVSLNLLVSMRQDYFEKISKLKMSFLDRTRHGDIISRGVNDIENIVNVVTETLTTFFSSIVVFTGCLCVMLHYNVLLTLICVGAAFISASVSFVFSGPIFRSFLKQQETLGEINSFSEDTFNIRKSIKLNNKEEISIKNFNKLSESLKKDSIKCMAYSSCIAPIMNIIGNLSFLLVTIVGGILTLKGTIEISTVVIFILYLRQFSEPVNNFANIISEIQTSMACATRFLEILDAPEEEDFYSDNKVTKGAISFENVNFSYVKGKNVLDGLNFNTGNNKTIAIVGKSGCGKTTLINLLVRYYDTDSGCIKINNTDIKDIPLKELRSSVTVILQNDYIFNNTLNYNITYSRDKVSEDEVNLVCERLSLKRIIKEIDAGTNTFINKHIISMGQTQIICLARAFFTKPKIVIFDESMSNVDINTQVSIHKKIQESFNDSIIIFITHNLLAIKDVDLIAVMDNGRIIEAGSHDELMSNQGFYRDLINIQKRTDKNDFSKQQRIPIGEC